MVFLLHAANERGGGGGGTARLWHAGRLFPAAPHHERWLIYHAMSKQDWHSAKTIYKHHRVEDGSIGK